MFSSSRGILYTAPPAAEDGDRERTADDREDAAAPEPDATGESAAEPIETETGVEDVSPTASRADWTGDLPADD